MMTDTPGSTQRLHLLYRLTQTFNSSLDLNEVLNRVMDEVVQAVEAERGFVMLSEDEGNLVFKTARGIDRKTIDDPQFQVSRSIVERVAREGNPFLPAMPSQMSASACARASVCLAYALSYVSP